MALSAILTRVGVAVSPLRLTMLSCKSSPAQTLVLFLSSPQSVALSPVSARRVAAGMLATLSHSIGGDKEGLSSGHKTDRLNAKLEILHTALQSLHHTAISVRYSTNIGIGAKVQTRDASLCTPSNRKMIIELQTCISSVPLDMKTMLGS